MTLESDANAARQQEVTEVNTEALVYTLPRSILEEIKGYHPTGVLWVLVRSGGEKHEDDSEFLTCRRCCQENSIYLYFYIIFDQRRVDIIDQVEF